MTTFDYSEHGFILLTWRCAYFCAMVSFHSDNLNSPLVVGIPSQTYLSEYECVELLKVLAQQGASECMKSFKRFSYDALMFFSSFFQCDLILDYIVGSMWETNRGSVHVLKLSCCLLGIKHTFTRKVTSSISDYLQQTTDDYVIELIHLIDFKGEAQAMRLLTKKIRDVSRHRRLIYSQFCMPCASCGMHIKFTYRGSYHDQAIFLKCCWRPIHLYPCFEQFVSQSYDMEVYCHFCHTRWHKASPVFNAVNREYRMNEYLQFFDLQTRLMSSDYSDSVFL